MKEYVSPQIECIDLRSEENIASQAGCRIGECHDDDGPIYLSPGS